MSAAIIQDDINTLDDEDIIHRCVRDYSLLKTISHGRLNHRLLDKMLEIDREVLREIPSQYWSPWAISLTLHDNKFSDIYDPSLVTKKIFDDVFIFDWSVVAKVPHELPNYDQCYRAAKSNIDVLPHIDPAKAKRFVKDALHPDATPLGAFSFIRDAYALSINDAIGKLKGIMECNDAKSGEAWVMRHRLRSLGRARMLNACKEAGEPDVYRELYGSISAARAFPEVSKRKWIESDLSL